MFEAFDIKNFQSWEHGHFDFHPGVNVLIGTSRNGKSAALRALRWTVENKAPKGEWRRWDSKKTETELTISEVGAITRRRTASKNEYELDGYEDPFCNVNKNVPEPIAAHLNLDPSLNFSWQHDRPFLLSETSGEVARQLNRFARLDIIGTSLSRIEAKERKNKEASQNALESVERLEKDYASFSYLDALVEGISSLESLDTRRNETERVADLLWGLLQPAKALEEELKKYTDVEAHDELLEELEGSSRKLRELWQQRTTLTTVCTSIEQRRFELEISTETTSGEPGLLCLEQMKMKCDEVTMSSQALHKEILNVEKTQTVFDSAKSALETLELKWEETAPETCPLCDGKGRLK